MQSPPPRPLASDKEPPLPVRISCPMCRKQLRLREDLLGQRVKCPACGHVVLAQGPPTSAADDPGPSVCPAPEETTIRRGRKAVARGPDPERASPSTTAAAAGRRSVRPALLSACGGLALLSVAAVVCVRAINAPRRASRPEDSRSVAARPTPAPPPRPDPLPRPAPNPGLAPTAKTTPAPSPRPAVKGLPELAVLTGGRGGPVFSWALTPDGRTLAVGRLGRAEIWDLCVRVRTASLERKEGQVVAIAAADSKTLLWCTPQAFHRAELTADRSGEKPLQRVPDSGTLRLAVSPDGRWFAECSAGSLRVWKVDGDGPRQTTPVGSIPGKCFALAFSPDGKALALGMEDGAVRLWDVEALRERRAVGRHKRSVTDLVYSPDGRTLASYGDDLTVRLWDLRTGDEMAALRDKDWQVAPVCFDREGKSFVWASLGGTVQVWDVAGRKLRTNLYSRGAAPARSRHSS